MPAPAKLVRFEIKNVDNDYLLHIESDGGETLQLTASHDQLDVLADTLDDILLKDEALDEVDAKD